MKNIIGYVTTFLAGIGFVSTFIAMGYFFGSK
jgi:hypothetical protein